MAHKRKAEDEPASVPSPARQRLSSVASLSYPSLSSSPAKVPPFQRPSQLLAFSYDAERVLEFNDSALRYFVEPPRGADLGFHYDKWIKRPEERGRLDGLLTAWTQFKKSLRPSDPSAVPDIHVMTWRGIMTKILVAPYDETDSWELNVMLVNGTFYLEEHLSHAKLRDKEAMTPRQRLQSYYGYAFESYCTSSRPGRRETDGWGGDVNTNVQWCSVVKTKLGDRRMVIGGEVDCVRDRYSGNTDNFVELKTSLTIRNASDEARFEKKLLKFYFQSFLLGVPEIVVGFRKPNGQLSTMQSFRTVEIPRLVRGKPGSWDPSICLEWGERFFAFLENTVRPGSGREVWRVTLEPKVGVGAALLSDVEVGDVENGEARVGFLPRWYWDDIIRSS